MSNYDLNDNVNDTFSFKLHGKEYEMRYPLTSEVEVIQGKTSDINLAQKEKRTDDVTKLSADLEDYLYSFISPVGHEEPFKEVIKQENVRVMRNFNIMIKKELALE